MAAPYQFPDVGVPFVNPETGVLNPVWFMFLLRSFQSAGSGATPFNDFELQALEATSRGSNQSDLANAIAELRALSGTARSERPEIERLRSRVADLESLLGEQRSERPEVERLRSRAADLESLLIAMRTKDSLIEDLRRDINDLKTLAQQVTYSATIQKLDVRLSQLETLVMGKR